MTLPACQYWRYLPGGALLALMVMASSGANSAAQEAQRPGGDGKATRPAGAGKPSVENRVELERLEKAQRHSGKSRGGNAFGATSWYVAPPPPKPLPPPPPPPPTAPPMPFSYLGLYEGGAGQVIMLVRGDRIYTVGVGDVIDNTYRIDRFDHGTVEMTYLPLNIKQSISTGNPS